MPNPEVAQKQLAATQRNIEEYILSTEILAYPRRSMPIPHMKSVPGYADFYYACLSQPQPGDLYFVNPPIYVATRKHLTAICLSTQENQQLEQLVHIDAVKRRAYGVANPRRMCRATRSSVLRDAVRKYIRLYTQTGAAPEPSPHVAPNKRNCSIHPGLARTIPMTMSVTKEENKLLKLLAHKLKTNRSELLRRALDAEFQLVVRKLAAGNTARDGYKLLAKMARDEERARTTREKKANLNAVSPHHRRQLRATKTLFTKATADVLLWERAVAQGGMGTSVARGRLKRARWEMARTAAQLARANRAAELSVKDLSYRACAAVKLADKQNKRA